MPSMTGARCEVEVMPSNKVSCADCGHDLTDISNIKPRKPCPECGSTSRKTAVAISAKVKIRASVSGRMKSQKKMKSGGRKRREREVRFGHSFHLLRQRWESLLMVIDRKKNMYEKTVTDKDTGEVVYHCKEPLSKHTGRGSAKHSKKKE